MKTHIIKAVMLLLVFFTGIKAHAQKTISLEEAIALSAQGNKVLKIQNLQELRAKQAVKEARGEFLPNLAFNGNVSKYFDRQVIFLPGSFAGTNNAVQDVSVGGLQQYNGVVSLNQTLFSKRTKEALKASLVEEKIEQEKTADVESQLIQEITKIYYQVLLNQNQLVLLEKSLNRNEKALKDAKSLYLQGKGLKTDTLSSYIVVENLKTSVAYQKSRIEISKTQLKQLIGWDEQNEIDLIDSLLVAENSEAIDVMDDDIVVEELSRQDIAIQKLSIELEEKRLAAIKATRHPEVSLIGQYQIQSQADDMKLSNQTWHNTTFVGANLSIPIFNGGRTSSKVKQSQLKLEQEKIKIEDLYDAVKLELATIISDWNHAKLQYETQKRTVEAAEVNYVMNTNRYSNGIGSKLEVTDAELALTTSQINFLYAIYNLKINKTELQRAVGKLNFSIQ
ncbi:TolC family protein [Mariniflexile soesokkakense]|uniref:TolC family protein n=1 Tax=Mariniflexile soesokkakense TaxID=1343160 RepID=A0ABV0AHL8_9FLAO